VNPLLAARRCGLAAALLLAACSSRQEVPAAEVIRNAGNVVAEAEDARASDYAPKDMRAARDKLVSAQELSRKARNDNNQGEMEQARWLAEEATADAKLAEAKAKNTRMHGLLRDRQRSAPPPPQPAGEQPIPDVVPAPPGNGS
jgi:hypothetical protein